MLELIRRVMVPLIRLNAICAAWEHITPIVVRLSATFAQLVSHQIWERRHVHLPVPVRCPLWESQLELVVVPYS